MLNVVNIRVLHTFFDVINISYYRMELFLLNLRFTTVPFYICCCLRRIAFPTISCQNISGGLKPHILQSDANEKVTAGLTVL